MRTMLLAVTLATALVGCASEATSDAAAGATDSLASAPTYEGPGFHGARILRISDGAWLTDAELVAALADANVTVFGEQHNTVPVQALERWVLEQLVTRQADLGLGMEHFQRDEQPVIDRYLAGEIDQATFEATAQVWPDYATYWRPLVEEARTHGRPVLALNVPKEALGAIYGQFPTWPLEAFQAIPETDAWSAFLPPRPLPAWDTTYQSWFETSFDYASHGQGMGLDYAGALHYFTDLAQIRDETMAHWVTQGLATRTRHLMVVAGDWHVQTRLALPDRVVRLDPSARVVTITTTPDDRLDELRAFEHAGRRVADYILAYATATR